VNGLVQLALSANPRLARANALVEAARGRQVQAGLRPNPVFAFNADELGDRTGPMGLLSPSLSQEFVLGGKLSLAQAVVAKEVDQATLDALAQRYAVAGAVRAAAYELAALRQRHTVLGEVVGIAEQSVEQATKAEKNPNGTLTRGDVLPLEVELERFKAEREAVEREIPAAERRLAALTGDARMPVGVFAADLSAPLPEYDLDAAREAVLEFHPEVRAAAVAVDRAQAAVRRAEAELIPNVTGSIGYVRQNQNLSNDWSVGVSVPLVIHNKNQGNIRAARAEVVAATLEVTRVQNDLAERVATAFRTYAAARRRADKYRTAIVPKAEENYAFVKRQLDRGVVEYLRVLQAQRAVAEAKLEANRAVGEAWTAAGELSGLLMEEAWPRK
jgi:outer membrane protein, heavy metal efflux system